MIRKLTMGRVLVLLQLLLVAAGGSAVFVAGITGSLPKSWQDNVTIAATMLAGLAASLAATIKFLDGSQKSEALNAHYVTTTAAPGLLDGPAESPGLLDGPPAVAVVADVFDADEWSAARTAA